MVGYEKGVQELGMYVYGNNVSEMDKRLQQAMYICIRKQ